MKIDEMWSPLPGLNELLTNKKTVHICAPMVRYSKLPFRKLVRKYGVDLCFTPMIISSGFVASEKCRQAEFVSDNSDHPLITQFAASNALDLANAAEIVSPFCEGVDLNCGCPQRWVMSEGYGSHLIKHPELVSDMVSQTRNRISNPSFSISIKIRLQDDLRKSVDLCQKAQAAGVSFLTVHGRTPKQRKDNVNYDAIRIIKDSLDIPVFANGDICSLEDTRRVVEETGVDGVMSARGLLHNPSLFTGTQFASKECILDFISISLASGSIFTLFHHHLMFMLDKQLNRTEKRFFNRLQSVPAVIDYLNDVFE